MVALLSCCQISAAVGSPRPCTLDQAWRAMQGPILVQAAVVPGPRVQSWCTGPNTGVQVPDSSSQGWAEVMLGSRA